MSPKPSAWSHLAPCLAILVLGGCTAPLFLGAVPSPAIGPWEDGVYTGFSDLPTPQLVVVEVSIAGGRIVALRLRRHPAWKAPAVQEQLVRAVLAQQTTDLGLPRPPGSEQDQLLRAIEDALAKARRHPPGAP
ncbi:MAG: hypothetical protein KatS3mg131_3696 [Candidatus Tectimicrobiota bacterium]|nr:MAG: hypothetical protein KatS3mg131_3696 [Candidatus Tectomicrobia bacterium]